MRRGPVLRLDVFAVPVTAVTWFRPGFGLHQCQVVASLRTG